MSIALRNAFHHLVFHITAKRLSKTGGLGKEHWGRGKATTISISPSEGKAPSLTPFLGSKKLCSFPSLCMYLSRWKISNRGNWGRFCKVMEILSSLDICQGMKKHNMKDDNLVGNTLAALSLTKKDLPSQISSFLVEVQWSTWRPTASSLFLLETGTNNVFWKCLNFLYSKHSFSLFWSCFLAGGRAPFMASPFLTW